MYFRQVTFWRLECVIFALYWSLQCGAGGGDATVPAPANQRRRCRWCWTGAAQHGHPSCVRRDRRHPYPSQPARGPLQGLPQPEGVAQPGGTGRGWRQRKVSRHKYRDCQTCIWYFFSSCKDNPPPLGESASCAKKWRNHSRVCVCCAYFLFVLMGVNMI